MNFLNGLKRTFSWLVNPIANVIDLFQHTKDNSHTEDGRLVYDTPDGRSPGSRLVDRVSNDARQAWRDYTGQSQIDQEFQNNMELARYQSDLNEEFYNKYSSPEAIMKQYAAAGLNPALMYGGAGSGQGNVPSYTAPNAIRGLSMQDKMSKALSMLSTIVGFKNLVYNSVALREAAEQAALKTSKDREQLSALTLKNMLNYNVIGQQPSLGIHPFFRRSSLGRLKGDVSAFYNEPTSGLAQYANSVRTETLNRAVKAAYDNRYMYGSFYSPSGLFEYLPVEQSRAYWLNEGTKYQAKQRWFNYDWDQEFKTMMKGLDVAGKLGYGLYRMLLGK